MIISAARRVSDELITLNDRSVTVQGSEEKNLSKGVRSLSI